MDNTKEYIVCAAIKRLEINPCIQVMRYKDIYEVELGMSHADILHRFEGVVSKSPMDQGFFTSYRRYVDRVDGFTIAKACGQISEHDTSGILFSEMIY